MWAGLLKISLSEDHARSVGDSPSGLLTAASEEVIIDSKGTRLGDSPWVHLFTANAIFEDGLALKDQSGYPTLGETFCKRRSTKAPADDYDVIPHAQLPRLLTGGDSVASERTK